MAENYTPKLLEIKEDIKYVEELIVKQEELSKELQEKLDGINTMIARTNDEGHVSVLLHTQEKLHDNHKIVSLEIQINRAKLEIKRIMEKYESV